MTEKLPKSNKAATAMRRIRVLTALAMRGLAQEKDQQHQSPKTQQVIERLTGTHPGE